MFETVSGFTTTGASILTDVEALDNGMLFWRSFTHWLGGMGILVFMLSLVNMGGQANHLLRAESPGPTVSKMVPNMRKSAAILYGIYIVMTAVPDLRLVHVGGQVLLLRRELVRLVIAAGNGQAAGHAQCHDQQQDQQYKTFHAFHPPWGTTLSLSLYRSL